MGRARDTAGSGATRGDGRNGTHLEGGGDTAGDERGARDLSMRPVRLAICERPLRGDRSTRFISPMNVVVSRLVKSHLRVSVLMRDLREGSGGADVDPLRVATLAGFAVTFAMAAALRQRRTNNAAQADDDDDEPAAARPRSRASKSAKSSSRRHWPLEPSSSGRRHRAPRGGPRGAPRVHRARPHPVPDIAG